MAQAEEDVCSYVESNTDSLEFEYDENYEHVPVNCNYCTENQFLDMTCSKSDELLSFFST